MTKRPLMFVSISFALGIVAGAYMQRNCFMITVLSLAVTLMLYLKQIKNRYIGYILAVLLLMFVVGYARTCTIYNKRYTVLERAMRSEKVCVWGKIVSDAELNKQNVSYVFEANEILLKNTVLHEKFKLKLTVICGGTTAPKLLKYGQYIKVQGAIYEASGRRNPYGFDYKRYLKNKDIQAVMTAMPSNVELLTCMQNINVFTLCAGVRERLINIINSTLPIESAALLKGMLLGVKHSMSIDLETDFSRCGLSHIMCVSGMNISFVALFFMAALNMLKVKKRITYLVCIIAILLFILVVGCSAPVVRAGLMGIIMVLSKLLGKKSDAYTSVAVACFIISLFNPLSLFDIGFQLSVAGTLALVMLYNPIKKNLSFLPGIVSDVAACTLAAQIGVLPIALYYFNALSIISLITNIIIVPTNGIITVLGFISVLLGEASIELSRFLSGINFFLLKFILFVVKTLSDVKWAVVYIPTPSLARIAAYYIVVALFIAEQNFIKKQKILFMCLCTYLIICGSVLGHNGSFAKNSMKVTFLDVGQGDCAFIETCEGKRLLIDCGFADDLSEGFDAGKDIIAPFLFDKGITRLDMVLISHAHSDHFGGLPALLEKIKVKNIVMDDDYNTKQIEAIKNIAESKGIHVFELKQGDVVNLDKHSRFEVIYSGLGNNTDSTGTANVNGISDSDEQKDCNDASYVIKLSYKNSSVLFTGDAGNDVERYILENGRSISCQVLKVAHHGSAYSTSEDFIKAVKPSVAVVSVGKNSYGHPDCKGTLKRIKDVGAAVFRTDECGAITIIMNDKNIKVKTMIDINDNLTGLKACSN